MLSSRDSLLRIQSTSLSILSCRFFARIHTGSTVTYGSTGSDFTCRQWVLYHSIKQCGAVLSLSRGIGLEVPSLPQSIIPLPHHEKGVFSFAHRCVSYYFCCTLLP